MITAEADGVLAALVRLAEEADRTAEATRSPDQHCFRRGYAAGLWRAANETADVLRLTPDQCPGRLREKRVIRAKYERPVPRCTCGPAMQALGVHGSGCPINAVPGG